MNVKIKIALSKDEVCILIKILVAVAVLVTEGSVTSQTPVRNK